MKTISFILIIHSLLFVQANAQNIKIDRNAIDKTKNLLKAENKTMYSDQVEDMWLECTSNELLNWYSSANPNEKKAFEAAKGEHPIINQKKKACLKSTLNTIAGLNEGQNKIEVFKRQQMVNVMKESMLASMDSATVLLLDIDIAVNCVYEKIKYIVPGAKEMGLASDPNSVYAKEIFLPCVQLAAKNASQTKVSTINSVIGGVEGPDLPTRISTLPINNLQAVGLKVENKSYYFVIDSGASYVIVSDKVEQQFLLANIITKKDYTAPTTIVLADGRQLTVRKFFLPKMALGKYIITNVEICVVPNASYPLLGKSFLNKFASWSIDNTTKDLILTK